MTKKKIGEVVFVPFRYKIPLKRYKNKFIKDLKERFELTDKQSFEISVSVQKGEVFLTAITTKFDGELKLMDLGRLK